MKKEISLVKNKIENLITPSLVIQTNILNFEEINACGIIQ